MSVATPATSAIMEEMEAIAGTLGEDEILATIEAIHQHRATAKPQLLVLGATGSGRASVVNALLRRPGLVPVSPIPRAPVGIAISHGERTSAIRAGRDGARSLLTPDQLAAILLDIDLGSDERVEIRADVPLLETFDVRIETFDTQAPGGWHDLLTGTDYAILVLNATALLSTTERAFIRQHLAPELGLERVAIVINQMDRIPTDERGSIRELVDTFLGPFQSQPAILDLSARDQAGQEALATLVRDISERRAPLRAEAIRQWLDNAVTALEDAAARAEALYALEASEVERLQAEIASRGEWLKGRIERRQRRIEAMVESLLKEQLLRRIEGFGEVFRDRLPAEIEAVADVSLVRRHLAGYIETVWTEFLRGQMISLRGALAAEAEAIDQQIEADLREMLAGQDGSGITLEFAADPSLHVYVKPQRGKHRAKTVVRGLSVHGYVMLFFSPAFGFLSLAASQAVQRIFQEQIGRADRAAFVASATRASRELEREIKERVGRQVADLAGQLKQDVAESYQLGTRHISDLLHQRTERQSDLEARRQEIARIRAVQLPRLRAWVTPPGDGGTAP